MLARDWSYCNSKNQIIFPFKPVVSSDSKIAVMILRNHGIDRIYKGLKRRSDFPDLIPY